MVRMVTECYSTKVAPVESSLSIAPLSQPEVRADGHGGRDNVEE